MREVAKKLAHSARVANYDPSQTIRSNSWIITNALINAISTGMARRAAGFTVHIAI